MKLTKQMKEDIARSIQEDLFPHESEKMMRKGIGVILRDYIEKDTISGWRKYKKHIDTRNYILLENSPIKSRPYGNNQFYCDEYPHQGCSFRVNFFDLTKQQQLLVKKFSEYLIKIENTMLDIKKVLNTFTTDKKLISACPEFGKYIISENVNLLPVPIEDIKKIQKILKQKEV